MWYERMRRSATSVAENDRVTLEPNATRTSWQISANSDIGDGLIVHRQLGGGKRYEVFLAWDHGLSTEVAVKALRPHLVGDERAVAALRREAQISARLSHPNLVRLVRWTDRLPMPHLVFELVEAIAVADHLEEIGPVRVPETCLLGLRIASALGYMHGEGVLHLDVKPANVTMGDPPRLLDLSLARVGLSIQSDHAIGTGAYMAPEQCLRGTLTPATDVFGLGATLYEALTAMQPFSEGDPEATDIGVRYPQLVEDALPLDVQDPGIPPALNAVVTACLAREPRRRPAPAHLSSELIGILRSVGLGHLIRA